MTTGKTIDRTRVVKCNPVNDRIHEGTNAIQAPPGIGEKQRCGITRLILQNTQNEHATNIGLLYQNDRPESHWTDPRLPLYCRRFLRFDLSVSVVTARPSHGHAISY